MRCMRHSRIGAGLRPLGAALVLALAAVGLQAAVPAASLPAQASVPRASVPRAASARGRAMVPALASVAPVTPRAAPHTPRGYWLTTANGAVYAYGGAAALGSAPGGLVRPVVGMATTPEGNGYWLAASDGGIFAFGLPFLGSTGGIHLNQPVVGIAASPLSSGYWEVASDGGIFNFGVPFYGSTGSIRLNQPIVGMASTPDGGGYWLVASDGGIFSFGDANFYGSTGSIRLNKPIVGMAPTPSGHGYWLVASDGGIFSFGDAVFFGSAGGAPTNGAVVGMTSVPNYGPGKVSTFFYPWYATPTSPYNTTGGWLHWNEGGHTPPYDIGSSYYPSRGAYGSTDPTMIDPQMAEIAAAGINQIVVSWWGQGTFEDRALSAIQPYAYAHGLDVAVHLEPYSGRSAASVTSDIAYLMNKGITEFYVYEATQIPASAWAAIRAQYPSITLFATGGSTDFVLSGGLASFAAAGGFDGIYTYDPLDYQGSDFPGICAVAHEDGLECAPSVAPGYDATRATGDTRVRSRQNGQTYNQMWAGAITAAPEIVSITSYNEWHEGSQIEPAQPFCIPDQGTCYENYTGAYGQPDPQARGAYLAATAYWAAAFRATRTPGDP